MSLFDEYQRQQDIIEKEREERDLFAQFKRQREQELAGILYQSMPKNPDHVVKAHKVGTGLGIPPSLLEDNLPEYENLLKHKINTEILRADPKLSSFITPQNAPIVQDDLENLSAFGKIWEGINKGAEEALTNRERSFAHFRDMMTFNNPTQFSEIKEEEESWLFGAGKFAGNIFTQLGASVASGGLKGAVVGSAVPVVGTGLGFAAGISSDQAMQAAGSVYKEAFDALTANGIPEDEARNLALQAGMKSFGGNFATGLVPITRATRLLGAAGGANIARATLRGTIEEGVEEVISEGINIYAVERAKQEGGIDNAIDNASSEHLTRIALRLGEAGFVGGMAGGVMSGTFHATGKIFNTLNRNGSRDPEFMEDRFNRASEAVRTSRTATRDPETFRDFAETVTRNAGVSEIHVPRDSVIEKAQKNPDKWRRAVPDIDEQLEESATTGSDITVKSANAIVYLQDDLSDLLPDSRYEPDGLTANEKRDLVSQLPTALESDFQNFMDSITGDSLTPEDQLKSTIFNDVVTQLEDAGFGTAQDRTAFGILTVQRYMTRAIQNSGQYGNALDEYQRNPFIVEFLDQDQPDFQTEQTTRRDRVEPSDFTVSGSKIGEGEIKIKGEYHPTDIMIVEADSLFPSLEGSETQYKDRTRSDAENQIEEYVRKLDPRYLMPHFPDQVMGAPTLTPDNQITGGNVRSEAIKRYYQRTDGGAYRKMVEAEAKKAKVNIKGIKNPVIVRVLVSDVSSKEAAMSSNEGAYSAQSSVEQATVDAQRLGDISNWHFDTTGSLFKKGNETALTDFLSKYPTEERSGFTDKKGQLSLQGEKRILSAIMRKAYGDDPVIYSLLETGGEYKNITNALSSVASSAAQVQDKIASGKLHDVNPTQDILDGVNKLLYLRSQGMTVDSYLVQTSLEPDPASRPEVDIVLKFLDDNIHKPRVLRNGLSAVYDKIEEFGDPQQETLIPVDPPQKIDALSPLKKPETLEQQGRGRIVVREGMNVIELFSSADPSTLIHEFSHKWLDELLIDSLADNATASVSSDYTVIQNWMIGIVPEIRKYHHTKNRVKVHKKTRKEERRLINEIDKRGGDDYVIDMIQNGFPVKDDVDQFVKTMMHEAWARGFETYVMEGKSPNRTLRESFRRLSYTIRKVYQGVTSLGIDVNDDIRGVFDRLVAADATARQTTEEFGFTPIFLDRKSSGMSETMFERYTSKMGQQLESLREKLTQKRMKSYKENRTKQDKAELGKIITELTNESINSRPVVAFDRITGASGSPPILIDLERFKAQFDGKPKKDKDGNIVKGNEKLSSFLPKEVFSTKDTEEGSSASIVSAQIGYSTPIEMINDLIALEAMRKKAIGLGKQKMSMDEARKKHIERIANKRFEAYKDEQNEVEKAHEEAVRENIIDLLGMEINALAETVRNRLGIEDFQHHNAGSLHQFARNQFEKTKYNKLEINEKKYLRAATNAASKAQAFLLDEKFLEAYQSKREQIIALGMYKEALAFKKQAAQTQRLIQRIVKNKTLKNVDNEHMHLLHAILDSIGIRTARSQKKSRVNKDMSPFEAIGVEIQNFTQNDTMGDRDGVYISPIVYGDINNLTVNDFMDLSASLHSIYQHGQDVQFEINENEALSYNETVEGMARLSLSGKEKKLSKYQKRRAPLSKASKDKIEGFSEGLYNWWDSIMGSQRRAESIANEFDGYNPEGLWNTVLVEPLQKGKRGHFTFMTGFNNILVDFSKRIGGKKRYHQWQADLMQEIPNTTLFDYKNTVDPSTGKLDGQPELLPLRKIDLLTMAFNLGSPENFEKLIKGREETPDGRSTGWNEGTIRGLIDDYLTKEDWDFVVSIARHVGTQWKQLKTLETKLKGFPPPEVITSPVSTPHGTFDGWYWPILYDHPLKVGKEDAVVGAIFESQISSSATHARISGVRKPMLINFARMMDEIERNSYYVNMAEPVLNAGKILSDERIVQAVSGSKGEYYHKALVDWVRDVSNRNRRTIGEKDFLHPLGNVLSKGASINFFTYAAKPALDNLSELVLLPLKKEVGIKGAKRGLFWLMKNLNNTQNITDFMNQFVDHQLRHGGVDKRLAEMKAETPNKWGAPQRIYEAAIYYGYWVMTTLDGIKNTIAAKGAYENYLEKKPNASQEEIVSYVNKIIREISPARDVVDQSLTQRDKSNSHLKLYTSFPNAMLNRITDEFLRAKGDFSNQQSTTPQKIRATLRAAGKPAIMAFVVGWFFQMLSGAFLGKDDEEAGAIEQIVKGTVGGYASLFPVLGQFYDVATSNMPFAGSSLDVRFSALRDSVRDTRKLVLGKQLDENMIVNYLESIGFVSTTPIKRPLAALRLSEDMLSGEYDYSSFAGFVGDLQRGRQINK